MSNDQQEGYTFEPNTKSWRGPVMASVVLMKHTKRIKNKLRQLDLQKKQETTLKVKKDAVDEPEVDLEESDEEVEPIDPDTILEELPLIKVPFYRYAPPNYTPWRAPVQQTPERAKNFEFEKTRSHVDNASFTSPKQQMIRMAGDMELKDKEIEMLRHQLNKAHDENYKLTQELQGFQGKHYGELLHENAELKHYMERLHRENMKLQGDRRKGENSVLRKIHAEEQLEKIRVREYNGTYRK